MKQSRDMESTNQIAFGIGAGGWIQNGTIFTGATGSGCEIGHIKVSEETDFSCGCGHYGCLESIVSAKEILNLVVNFFKANSG